MNLIERIEKATAGGWELDAEIHVTLGGEDCRGDERLTEFVVPHYTTSVDAALTLVPEGEPDSNDFEVCLEQSKGCKNYWWATIGHHQFDAWDACAKTAPLALCIAALKGREQAREAVG